MSFENDVLDRSRATPVLVDFWAPWCGPCRILGPVLEELAAGADGRWELVKVNTEDQPDLAQRYGIMSIPAVKLFHQGEVVADFVGALPRAEIERWLGTHIPDPDQEKFRETLARWESEGAGIAAFLERFLEDHPDHQEAPIRLAQSLVGVDPGRARTLLEEAMRGFPDVDLVADVASLADLMEWTGATPERARPHVEGAREALRDHDLDRALEHLVDAAMVDRHFGDELARRAAVALFRLLGHDHPLTQDHQRRLSMALHS